MALGRSVQIAPSILSANFAELGDQVLEAERAGADLLHIDVMDGRFVPNITVGPLVVRALRSVTQLPLHVHLMIEEPERHIDAFARAGADLITVHVETCPHLHRTIQQVREAIPFTLNKVRQLADMLDERHLAYRIQVDGGVNMSTLDQVLRAGADVLVIGSAIFASGEGIGTALERFRTAINEKRSAFLGLT